MTPHAQLLMKQLLAQNAQTIGQRLIDDCINTSKTYSPVQLSGDNVKCHWDEIKTIAHYWGRRAPFEFDQAEQAIATFFVEQLYRLPPLERATLYIGGIGAEEFSEAKVEEFADAFQLTHPQFSDVLCHLMEQLMSFVRSGQAPDDYQASEIEKFMDQVDRMEAQLKYFRKAHQALASSHAHDIRQRLVADLKAEAKSLPAFDIADEGCRSHWDEICVMARVRADHMLFGALQSTLEQSALRAIKKLPEEQKCALWADTCWGSDWVETCEWDDFPVDLYTDNDGLIEAAEVVREVLFSATSGETFYHDEFGEQAHHTEEDDLSILQAVADGTHPLMLEPELADVIESVYLRRSNVAGIETLLKLAVDSYTNAALKSTETSLLSPR